jgi:hypothetical protein
MAQEQTHTQPQQPPQHQDRQPGIESAMAPRLRPKIGTTGGVANYRTKPPSLPEAIVASVAPSPSRLPRKGPTWPSYT